MTDLNKVILCLEKIEGKNLEQNPENLKHFSMKDFDYESEDAKNFIEEAIVTNVINGKVAYLIAQTDSIADATVFIPDTQEVYCHDEKNNATVTIEDTQISSQHQRISNINISSILEKFRSSLEAIDKRFLKIEDHLIGLSYSKSTANSNSRDATLGKL